jgi:hypothetical protein
MLIILASLSAGDLAKLEQYLFPVSFGCVETERPFVWGS